MVLKSEGISGGSNVLARFTHHISLTDLFFCTVSGSKSETYWWLLRELPVFLPILCILDIKYGNISLEIN